METHRRIEADKSYVNLKMKETRRFARVRAVENFVEGVEALEDKGFPKNGMKSASRRSRRFACIGCQK